MGLCPGLLTSSMGSQDGVAATPCAETKHRDICIQLPEMGVSEANSQDGKGEETSRFMFIWIIFLFHSHVSNQRSQINNFKATY